MVPPITSFLKARFIIRPTLAKEDAALLCSNTNLRQLLLRYGQQRAPKVQRHAGSLYIVTSGIGPTERIDKPYTQINVSTDPYRLQEAGCTTPRFQRRQDDCRTRQNQGDLMDHYVTS